MQVRFDIKFWLAGGVALLLAGPVSAIDMTGEWHGTKKCTLSVEGQPEVKDESDVLFRISQNGNQVAADIGGLPFSGVALTDSEKTEKGVVSLVRCGTSVTSETIPTELYTMNAKATAEAGVIKGTTFSALISLGLIEKCSYKLERTSLVDPDLSGCN